MATLYATLPTEANDVPGLNGSSKCGGEKNVIFTPPKTSNLLQMNLKYQQIRIMNCVFFSHNDNAHDDNNQGTGPY